MNLKPKILCSLAILLFILGFHSVSVSANDSYNKVIIDAKQVSIDNKEIDGVLFINAESAFKAVSWSITYNNKSKNYTITDQEENNKYIFKVNDLYYYKNGKKLKNNVPPKLVSNTLFINARLFSSLTGNPLNLHPKYNAITFGYWYPAQLKPTNASSDTQISSGTGNLKGLLTWQYNEYIGTKPDVGANIILIPAQSKGIDDSFLGLVLKTTPQGNNGVYTGVADGYGNYQIDDIPSGEYVMLLVSKNTNSDMIIYDYEDDLFGELFNEDTWEGLRLNLTLKKHTFKSITIQPNKTYTESYDFGYTYI